MTRASSSSIPTRTPETTVMKPSIGALLILLVTGGSGCSGPSLGELEGTYDLTSLAEDIGSGELVDCNLVVERGGGSARCERTSAVSAVVHETLAIDLAVGDDTVDAEIVYVAENNGREGCHPSSCTTTITGEARRNQRNDAKRREMFDAAAGEWSGHVVIEKQCIPLADSEALERCHEFEEASDISTYAFDASIFGGYAEIEWFGQDESGGIEVIGTGDTIQVDGVMVPKR